MENVLSTLHDCNAHALEAVGEHGCFIALKFGQQVRAHYEF